MWCVVGYCGKYLYVRDVVEVSDGLAMDTICQLLQPQPVALAYLSTGLCKLDRRRTGSISEAEDWRAYS